MCAGPRRADGGGPSRAASALSQTLHPPRRHLCLLPPTLYLASKELTLYEITQQAIRKATFAGIVLGAAMLFLGVYGAVFVTLIMPDTFVLPETIVVLALDMLLGMVLLVISLVLVLAYNHVLGYITGDRSMT